MIIPAITPVLLNRRRPQAVSKVALGMKMASERMCIGKPVDKRVNNVLGLRMGSLMSRWISEPLLIHPFPFLFSLPSALLPLAAPAPLRSRPHPPTGFCTCMKTVEITRHKQAVVGVKPASTFAVFMDIYRREGIKGINKGVNAVALRQLTNWGSR